MLEEGKETVDAGAHRGFVHNRNPVAKGGRESVPVYGEGFLPVPFSQRNGRIEIVRAYEDQHGIQFLTVFRHHLPGLAHHLLGLVAVDAIAIRLYAKYGC